MSQATLLGICSDNVVTILQPSSTIECTVETTDPGTNTIFTVLSEPIDYGTQNPLTIAPTGNTLISGYVVFSVNPPLSSHYSTQIVIGSYFLSSVPIPQSWSGISISMPFQLIVPWNATPTIFVYVDPSIRTASLPVLTYSSIKLS
jgi:hypothetical protein